MSTFKFIVGETYETQNGEQVTVLGRTDLLCYECVECSDGRFRYDRSNHSEDAGRCTGTNHDYSYPHNFKRQGTAEMSNETKNIDSISDDRTKNNTMRHQYKVLSDEEKADMTTIKDKGLDILEFLENQGESRELSIAKTKIEECVMWAVKHITT